MKKNAFTAPKRMSKECHSTTTSSNPFTDYCMRTSLTIEFTANIPGYENFSYEITRPSKDQGVVHEMSVLSPCGTQKADYFFEQGYCYHGCPAVTVGSTECNTNCIRCNDGYEALDCSNVDTGLVESCDVNTDDNFLEEVTGYFGGELEQEETFENSHGSDQNSEDSVKDESTASLHHADAIDPFVHNRPSLHSILNRPITIYFVARGEMLYNSPLRLRDTKMA